MTHARGLTLIEMLVVLAIMSLILAVVGTNLFEYLERAKEQTAKIQVGRIDEAVELHRLQHRAYPAGLDAIHLNADKPVPPDPWGVEYSYAAPGEHNPRRFDVASAGRDNQHATSDDVGNWEAR